jgi:ATP diphosphatase
MSDIAALLGIMARLRNPDGGCPWDLEQTFASIAPSTIEEAYEVADAIQRGDFADLRDELGDLLLQVVFHARMAEEAGHFDFADVVAAISDKLVRRHPHVFGAEKVADAAEQTRRWEDLKQQEREARAGKGVEPSALDGIAAGLPEWLKAEKLLKRAARVGFDWPDPEGVIGKLHEEIDEVRAELRRTPRDSERIEDEIGDVLFVCVNLARHAGVDFGRALAHANTKFERRFRAMESAAREAGTPLPTLPLAAQERLWQSVKSRA